MAKRKSVKDLTRDEYKQACSKRKELVMGCYCPSQRTRCDMEWPTECPRMWVWDLKYGDYVRKTTKSYNSKDHWKKKEKPEDGFTELFPDGE